MISEMVQAMMAYLEVDDGDEATDLNALNQNPISVKLQIKTKACLKTLH
jgi:hypothetical protein